MEMANSFFFSPHHHEVSEQLDQFADKHRELLANESSDEEEHALKIVRSLGKSNLLEIVVPAKYGGRFENVDVRSLCLARERLSYASSLADLMFGMQGLGSYS